jgi:hypothetical protein
MLLGPVFAAYIVPHAVGLLHYMSGKVQLGCCTVCQGRCNISVVLVMVRLCVSADRVT